MGTKNSGLAGENAYSTGKFSKGLTPKSKRQRDG